MDIEALIKDLRDRAGKYDEYAWHGEAEIKAADALERMQAQMKLQAERQDFMVAELSERAQEIMRLQAEVERLRKDQKDAAEIISECARDIWNGDRSRLNHVARRLDEASEMISAAIQQKG
jgi:sulfur transfer protein SufE